MSPNQYGIGEKYPFSLYTEWSSYNVHYGRKYEKNDMIHRGSISCQLGRIKLNFELLNYR